MAYSIACPLTDAVSGQNAPGIISPTLQRV